MTSLPRLLLSLLPGTLFALAACGGTVDTSDGGSGGTSSTSTNTGGEPPCPSDEPNGNSTCSVKDQICTYPAGCCSNVYQCDGSTWLPVPVDCLQPDFCPATLPATGQACDVCASTGPCTYDCPAAPIQVTASCEPDGTWTVGECPVPPPVDCGGTICKSDEVCVQSAGGAGFFYSCAPNPCGAQALSCACAASLCGSAPFQCDGVDPAGMVMCSCPVCP